ncbi:MAG: DnaB-like helicase C-terminal domain-containing protein [Candidatus Hydrogenedentota bacterium]
MAANASRKTCPAITTLDFRACVRQHVRKHGAQLVVLDYLQLLRPPSRRDMRSTEVAKLSAAAKAVAKECSVAVLCLLQLNRAGEEEPRQTA